MVRERMVLVRDERRSSSVVAGFIGVFSGAMVALIAVAQNTRPSDGFFGTLATNTVGVAVILTIALIVGCVIGFFVGFIEGALSYALAQYAAAKIMSLTGFSVTLGIIFSLINGTITAAVVGIGFGINGIVVTDSFAPICAMALTALAISAFSKLQASDWPQRVSPGQYAGGATYADIDEQNSSSEITEKHSRISSNNDRHDLI